jgi:hypothetical protein
MSISLQINRRTKSFELSTPVYRGEERLPQLISQFFLSLSVQEKSVALRKTIPFHLGAQMTLRQQMYVFARNARRCKKLIERVGLYEQIQEIKSALDL